MGNESAEINSIQIKSLKLIILMKSFTIPRPWVILWMLVCLSAVKPLRSAAQCAGTIQSTTYTATLSGTGNNTYAVNSIPKYPAAGPTLISVVVKSVLNVTSNLVLQNTNPTGQDFFPTISRSDVIKLNGTTLGAPGGTGYNGFPETILDPAGGPVDHITYPTTSIFTNASDYKDSVKSTDPVFPSFSGSGNLTMTYKSASFPGGIPTGINNNYNLAETITFTVTYYYCSIILSTNVLTFTATRTDNSTVRLNWTSSNEEAGSRYDVEVSKDGNTYAPFDSRPAIPGRLNSSYSDTYPITPGASGKLYFRLKIVNADGAVSFSPIREINLDGDPASSFYIYPNPPGDEYVNIVFGRSSANWQVDIFSANGRLVQRNSFFNTTTARLNFVHKMAAGAYFIRATDLGTAKSYSSSFLIR